MKVKDLINSCINTWDARLKNTYETEFRITLKNVDEHTIKNITLEEYDKKPDKKIRGLEVRGWKMNNKNELEILIRDWESLNKNSF